MSISEGKKKKKNVQTQIFVFGQNSQKQIIVENEIINKPEPVFIESDCIKDISCGASHTLICVCDGSLICAGDNSKNQFGKKDIKSPFEKVLGVKNEIFVFTACGDYFSAAVTQNGNLYTWGSNEYGELGHGLKEINSKMGMVKSLSTYRIVQVASGNQHCLALTNDSIVFAWGRNNCGQLGLSDMVSPVLTPQIVSGVDCLPISQIVAGHSFSACLSSSGSVFSWGSNKHCQLGNGISNSDMSHSSTPIHLKSIKGISVVYISCGKNHTAVLTNDGGVFTFGDGRYGQLGLGDFENQCSPRKVPDLMGSTVTQIDCGYNFTLALIDSSRLYAFGKCDSGQLGLGTKDPFINTPQKLQNIFTDGKKSNQDKKGKKPEISIKIRKICSGANHTVIILTDLKNSRSEDFRRFPVHEYNCIAKISSSICSEILKTTANLSDDIKSLVYLVMGSLGCLSSSFLDHSEKNSHFLKTKSRAGVDFEKAHLCQCRLLELLSKDEQELLRVHIYENLLSHRLHRDNYPAVECLRGLVTLLLSPLIGQSASYRQVTVPLFQCICSLADVPRSVIESWLSLLKPRLFKKIIESITGLIKYHVDQLNPGKTNDLPDTAIKQMTPALDVLKSLYVINERSKLVPYSCFYVTNINDKIDIERNFIEWATANTNYHEVPFSFCSYPFIFDGKAKTRLLQVEASLFMRNAVLETHTNMLMSILSAAATTTNADGSQQSTFPSIIAMENPFFVIGVNRETILEDTLKQLQEATHKDFKKPLKISFSNEEAVDDGGVVKEYFLLVIREIMLPKRGLFKCYKESNMCYFQQSVKDKDSIYRCVGQLCGLAIYNGVIVDLHFPLALFRKLLGETPDIDDLIELNPVVGKSLQQILDYSEPNFTDTFSLCHEIAWEDVNGKEHHKELFSNGKSTAVTLDSKEQYVVDYIQFILTENVASSFDAFKIGFFLVAVGSVIKLFKPMELQEMIVGSEITDWDEVQKTARYDGEFWNGHPVIKWFWEVFHELREEQKKQFLRFLTGCDRAPITGMSDFKIAIQPTNGGDSFFPVAHTCYNLLDLPKYSSKKILKSRLFVAIEHSEGFSLV